MTPDQAEALALTVHRDMNRGDVIVAVRRTNWSRITNPAAYIRSAKFLGQMPRAARIAEMAQPELSLAEGLALEPAPAETDDDRRFFGDPFEECLEKTAAPIDLSGLTAGLDLGGPGISEEEVA